MTTRSPPPTPTSTGPASPAFLTAVRAARKGEIVGVVVNEQSRLTRQGTGAWDELVVTLTKAGVTKVETLRAGPVSVEPGNRLVGRILAVVDAEEVERTKARCQDAHRELFNEGRPSGRAPFGYRSTKGDDGRPHLEPDPVEAPVVTQVFAWALEGHAIAVIADRLNEPGVLPRSARWTVQGRPRQVTGWKSNARAQRCSRRRPSPGCAPTPTPTAQLHTVPGRWEALVDVETWRRVQRMLGQPAVVTGANGETYRVRTKPKPQPRRYLLSGGRRRSGVKGQPGEMYGVLRCGKCGMPMVAQTQGRRGGVRVPAYQCHPKVDADACGGVSISPGRRGRGDGGRRRSRPSWRRTRSCVAGSPPAQDAEPDRWRAERDAAKARMLDAAQLLGAGTIDADTFDAMHGAAKAAYDAAEAQLAAMTTRHGDAVSRGRHRTLGDADAGAAARRRGAADRAHRRRPRPQGSSRVQPCSSRTARLAWSDRPL